MSRSNQESDVAPLQFSLLHLMLFTTASSFLLTFDKFIGPFATALLLGLVSLGLTVSLLRVENPILGGLIGFALAIVVLFGASIVGAMFEDDSGLGLLFAAIIIYPMIGYTIGCIVATFNSFRNE